MLFWVGTLAGISLLGFAFGIGHPETGTILLAVLFFVIISRVGAAMVTPADSRWLPSVVMAAFMAKLTASWSRYWVLVNLYNLSGDATGYHGNGTRLNDVWRSLSIPENVTTGTRFVQVATGALYVPYEPTFLGGFFIFATLAFLGQLLLYAAFRRSFPPDRLKWYAALVFFFPTIVYWPSSPGKEAFIMPFLGLAAYGAARLFSEYRLRWGIVIAVGLSGIVAVRPHVALLVAGAIFATLLLARAPKVRAAQARRAVLLGISVMGLAGLLFLTFQDFRLDLAAGLSKDLLEEEVDPFLSNIEARTDKGGSGVEGEFVRDPADLPSAFLRVLFRPLPTEAHNAQAFAASLEGAFLLALFVWRLPSMLRNLPRLRRHPYLVFCLVFTIGFVIAFSSFLNLGLLARQRSQVMPFVLAILVELGARRPKAKQSRASTEDRLGAEELAAA
jgi:hypothetical protein